MNAGVGIGGVAGAAVDVGALADSAGGQEYFCADGVAGTFGAADELQGDPVVVVLYDVAQEGGWRVHVINDDVNVAVVEEIAEGGAAGGNHGGKAAAGGGWDLAKLATVEVAEELGTLRPGGSPVEAVYADVDVAVGDEGVEQAVVVEVQETVSPSQEWDGGLSESGFEAYVGEAGVAVVAEQGFVVVGEGADQKIDLAVAIVVADGDSHGGLLASVAAQGQAGDEAYVFEGAVVAVAVEVAGDGIISDYQVEPAVVVYIDEDGGEAIVPVGVGYAGFHADVGEGAIAVVVEEMVGLAGESERSAEDVDAAELAAA